MNVKLLRKIQEHIIEEPKRFMMADTVLKVPEGAPVEDFGVCWAAPKCGTVACIAGWACILSNKRDGFENAQDALQIDHQQGDRLFLEVYWPPQFDAAWNRAQTPKARAGVAVRRINHFIKTGGLE